MEPVTFRKKKEKKKEKKKKINLLIFFQTINFTIKSLTITMSGDSATKVIFKEHRGSALVAREKTVLPLFCQPFRRPDTPKIGISNNKSSFRKLIRHTKKGFMHWFGHPISMILRESNKIARKINKRPIFNAMWMRLPHYEHMMRILSSFVRNKGFIHNTCICWDPDRTHNFSDKRTTLTLKCFFWLFISANLFFSVPNFQ